MPRHPRVVTSLFASAVLVSAVAPACFMPEPADEGGVTAGSAGATDDATTSPEPTGGADATDPSDPTAPTDPSGTDPTTDTVDDTGDDATDTGVVPEGGHVAYVLEGGLWVQEATPGTEPRLLGPELDALAPGVDEDFVQLSSDGAWLLLSSERFDAQCAGYACLSVVDIGVTQAEAVLDTDGAPIRFSSGNGGAITRGGTAIAFGAEGVHTRDLHWTERTDAGWTAPVVITADSPYAYNTLPRLDVNEQLVVFDCGDVPYGDVGTAICEVGIGGDGFRVVWTPDQVPAGGGTTDVFLHHPSYTPDGGIVFEASWTGEQLWALAPGAAEPVLLRADHHNDNAPCVLPDGRVASLWLGRRGSSGVHELAIKNADGSGDGMLLIDRDIADVGTACGL